MEEHKKPSTKSRLARHGAVHPTIENFSHGHIADGARTVGEYALKGLTTGFEKLQGAYEKVADKTESMLGKSATSECVDCDCNTEEQPTQP